MKWFEKKETEPAEPKEKKVKEKKPKKISIYEEARNQIRDEMQKYDKASTEYARLIEALAKVNEAEMKVSGPPLDPNKTLAVGAQTLSIGLLAVLDRHCPLIGKAWSWLKLKGGF